jgi:16S rRNA (adenine(1408)-N(1))-methyltransferase
MRIVNGKHVREMDARELADWRERYQEVVVDLGAGDGRFIRELAGRNRQIGAIGVDLCAANLRAASRTAGENALFIVADALALPEELAGVATRVTIHFPWGSLLRGLLTGHRGLLCGFTTIGNDETQLDLLLNAGALAEAGWSFELGVTHVISNLCHAGFNVEAARPLNTAELRAVPSTWAKRLAFGRDPRAVRISARLTRARQYRWSIERAAH